MGVDVEGVDVEIRAFRGTRRSAVYREHVVAGIVFARMLLAARDRDLPLLSSLDRAGPYRLAPPQARQLAREVDALEDAVRSPAFSRHLEAIGDVARWCARARGRSWMTIAPF
jgi:hypothetical protein